MGNDRMTLNQCHRQIMRQEQIINDKSNKIHAMQETIDYIRTENYELETALIAIGKEITAINDKIDAMIKARRSWFARIFAK